MEKILASSKLMDKVIIDELKEVAKNYGKPRRSLLYHPTEEDLEPIEEEIPDYPVHLFITKEGYFKKIVPQSLRMSSEHKLKEGDEISQEFEVTNTTDLLLFTNQHQVYKASAYDVEDSKASVMGNFLPAELEMDDGEEILYMAVTDDYSGYMMFVFDNGRVSKVEMEGYNTKTKRRKLISAYNEKLSLVGMFHITEETEILLRANNNRSLIFSSGALNPIATRSTQGVKVMNLRKNTFVENVYVFTEGLIENDHRFRTKNLPAAGSFPRAEDEGEQLSLMGD